MNELTTVVQHCHLAATNSEQMALSQKQMAEWFAARLRQADEELKLAEKNLEAARASEKFNLRPFQTALRNMRKEVQFYEKCAVATEHGYALVPSFPIHVFAVRTNVMRPSRMVVRSTTWSPEHLVTAKKLAYGDGFYVDVSPGLRAVQEPKMKDGKQVEIDGKLQWKTMYFADEDHEEINYPENIRHPLVIDAVSSAMDMCVFDDIAVLPQARKTDPMVFGRIHRPRGYRDPLQFLIAWYIDTKTL